MLMDPRRASGVYADLNVPHAPSQGYQMCLITLDFGSNPREA